jgi:hypothetical protein
VSSKTSVTVRARSAAEKSLSSTPPMRTVPAAGSLRPPITPASADFPAPDRFNSWSAQAKRAAPFRRPAERSQ